MADDALLRATGLGRRFGGLAAVDAVSIDLHVGEIHAVIGTNGAGKSTLVNMLSGELAPTAGSVRFAGHDVTRWAQPRRARAGLGRSYQRTTIFNEFSVLENCRLAAQAQAPRPWTFWERAAGDTPSLSAAKQALDAAGLAAVAARTAGTLSHGAKRQLEIAMCLATAPQCSSSMSRSPAWAARRAGGCWPCSPPSSPGTRSCWSSMTWTLCSASPTGSR